ncbi:MAG TPA: ribosome-associated translation inhibitor RaiA [Planctomycetaceae bacterium]|nr:ribosome-associated translation inhibitor RaiA [Planctomycetaceae bacterium]
MQIKISVRHGDLSEASQSKIRAKVEKLGRLFERLTSVEVTVDLEKSDLPKIELLVSAEHKNDFVASYSSDDMFGCLDQAIHKIEQQIRKYKERIQNHNRPERVDGTISEE